METLEFTIRIKATKEKVWSVLWDDKTYRKWTSAFSEGSHAVSTWNEGDKIQFLGAEDGGGMNSIIDKKVLYEYMAFKHLGEIKDFKELPIDEKANEWSGSMETYRLTSDDEFIDLKVQVDIIESHKDYFKNAFPKALEIVKELSEKQ